MRTSGGFIDCIDNDALAAGSGAEARDRTPVVTLTRKKAMGGVDTIIPEARAVLARAIRTVWVLDIPLQVTWFLLDRI